LTIHLRLADARTTNETHQPTQPFLCAS
jgi:hypothetical protein